ncbi:hypothetical protein OV079_51385 [Nannocystis pusilla]|uniref:Uncharacterized protein n=1 Tax=Nannocystis pusilla TaxID=889268 RepID=A0A9X3J3H9_9BACT|nr:hypothetical protein [Nannocystis pusilla]MCY1013796.1 hypothetical protein [Nannocystis pusilla]
MSFFHRQYAIADSIPPLGLEDLLDVVHDVEPVARVASVHLALHVLVDLLARDLDVPAAAVLVALAALDAAVAVAVGVGPVADRLRIGAVLGGLAVQRRLLRVLPKYEKFFFSPLRCSAGPPSGR